MAQTWIPSGISVEIGDVIVLQNNCLNSLSCIGMSHVAVCEHVVMIEWRA